MSLVRVVLIRRITAFEIDTHVRAISCESPYLRRCRARLRANEYQPQDHEELAEVKREGKLVGKYDRDHTRDDIRNAGQMSSTPRNLGRKPDLMVSTRKGKEPQAPDRSQQFHQLAAQAGAQHETRLVAVYILKEAVQREHDDDKKELFLARRSGCRRDRAAR